MGALEVGLFEMRGCEVGSFQNCTAKIERPVLYYGVEARLTAPRDHCRRGSDVFWRYFVPRRLKQKTATCPFGASACEPIGNRHLSDTALGEGRQVFHDCPIVVRTFLRDPLQGIDAAQAHLKLVTADLLDGLGKAFRDAALTISPSLFLVPPSCCCGLR